MPIPDTRASLLLRLRDPQDQSAWDDFLQIYQPLIIRLARSRGIQEADAHDISQEVLIAVAGAIGDWDPSPGRGSFRGWLSRITRNLVVNFLIRQSRHPRGSGDTIFKQWLDAQPDPRSEMSANFDREEARQVFRWAAGRVRPEFHETTWKAFWQTAVEDQDARRVASELGVPVGVVYVSRSRVMKRLRETILEVRGE